MSADLSRLVDLIEAFPRQTIVLLGDFVADEFVFGEISRVSREAPVLILRHRETQLLPGGGANAANNLADLGARVLPVTAVGDDAAGRALLDYFRRKGVDTSAILCVRKWATPTKTRYLAGWTHTARQQVLRVDREPSGELGASVSAAITRKARERFRRERALLVSDYGCGVATSAMLRKVRGRPSPEKLIT
ncbi:MAG: PfkB family carbohydrate kinase, partial [Candidatus Acidiferrales bacterium]